MHYVTLTHDFKIQKNWIVLSRKKFYYTVTSRLFTHTMSTEKIRKYMRDRKDMRSTNYT